MVCKRTQGGKGSRGSIGGNNSGCTLAPLGNTFLETAEDIKGLEIKFVN